MKINGMGSHESSKMKNDEWLTPPEIIKSLGEFDIDPCAPIARPWNTAKNHFNVNDDGLNQEWLGRVWCNPPYGRHTAKWLDKLKKHNNGIALIFARTETKMFFEHVWNDAIGILFFKGRLTFLNVDGSKPKHTGGAPSCLIAYGEINAKILKNAGINGKYITLKNHG